MHLMQHLSHHYVNKHLSRFTYGRVPAKGSNPVVIRNRRIDLIEGMDVLLSSAKIKTSQICSLKWIDLFDLMDFEQQKFFIVQTPIVQRDDFQIRS